eukprot:9642672-Ditylum_brightwellii.AAC.1
MDYQQLIKKPDTTKHGVEECAKSLDDLYKVGKTRNKEPTPSFLWTNNKLKQYRTIAQSHKQE